MKKNITEKCSKTKSDLASSTPIRVSQETYKKLISLLEKVNQKDFGKKIRSDDVIGLSLTLLKTEHFQRLHDESLTNADRMEILFREYKNKNKTATKEIFYGALLKGEIVPNQETKTASAATKKPLQLAEAAM